MDKLLRMQKVNQVGLPKTNPNLTTDTQANDDTLAQIQSGALVVPVTGEN